MKYALIAYIALAATAAGQSQAQEPELRPLVDIMSGGPSSYESSYPLMRCTGLYQAQLKWGGEKRLGSQLYNALAKNTENMLVGAIAYRMHQAGGTLEQIQNRLIDEIVSVMNVYIDRFRLRVRLETHADLAKRRVSNITEAA